MIAASFLMGDHPDADDPCTCGHRLMQHATEHYLKEGLVYEACYQCDCQKFEAAD